MTTTLSPSERSYIITGLAHPTEPTRLDGRALLAPRPIAVSYGDAPAANGSARVRVGGTEVLCGVRLEVADVAGGSSSAEWRAKVEVDVTPQAFPQANSQAIQHLSAEYAAFLADHFVPSIPALKITEKKYFVPHIHLTLISSDGAVLSTLVLAARGALGDLAVPKTKVIGWEAVDGRADADMDTDKAGIKGAVGAAKGKGRARVRGADDWDLDIGGVAGSDTAPLTGRDDLPVLVTLNLVPDSEAVFVDATPQEESACPGRVHVFVRPSGKLCGVRVVGSEGIPAERVRPLLEEAQRIGLALAASLNEDLP